MAGDWSKKAQTDADANASRKKAGSSSEPCPLDWIKLELLDDEGNPVADEPYVLVLKDGTEKKGNLDSKGSASIQEIPSGEHLVRFPNRQIWDMTETKTWFSFQLLDALGKPVPEEPFELTLPNGEVMEGTLDKNGEIHVNEVFPGMCYIVFPKRNELGTLLEETG